MPRTCSGARSVGCASCGTPCRRRAYGCRRSRWGCPPTTVRRSRRGNGDPLGYSPVRSEGADPVSEPAFHLTPLDVRKQEFRRRLRGYEPLGVEDFRVRVADELERILREKSVLEER